MMTATVTFTKEFKKAGDSGRKPSLESSSAVPTKAKEEIPTDPVTHHKKIREKLWEDRAGSGVKLIFDDYDGRPGRILTMRDDGERNILYTTIEFLNRKAKEDPQLVLNLPASFQNFLEYLVIKYPETLERVDDDTQISLELASKRNTLVFFLFIDLVVPQETINKLKKTCETKSDPTIAGICSVHLSKKFVEIYGKSDDAAPGKCLHDLIDVRRLENWNTKLRDILGRELRGRNNQTCLHILLTEETTAFTSRSSKSSTLASSFERLIRLCQDDIFSLHDNQGYTPLHRAIQLFKMDGIDFGQLKEVIYELVRRSPKSIYAPARVSAGGKTPYRLLKDLAPVPGSITNQLKKDKEKARSEVEQFLRHSCIGDDYAEDEKWKYLYENRKDELKIDFDLANLEARVDRRYVENVSEKVNLHFDTALEYVSLPQYNPDKSKIPSIGQNVLQQTSTPGKGKVSTREERDFYRGVFEWLAAPKGVKKIFKVTVKDLGPTPHSDEAIEIALKDFDVEIWDWRKLDLCSETILKAAENVRDLYLYSSGNYAILQSWACEDGLTVLKKLESVTVMMYPDLREKKSICEHSFGKFKEKFLKRRPEFDKDKIKVKYPEDASSPRPGTGGSKVSNDAQQTKQAWLERMRVFREFMGDLQPFDFKKDTDPPRVKIALLDNGVDPDNSEIANIERGASFRGKNKQDPFYRDYFTGPSQHGTQMAACIRNVCPMADLYVARMDDSHEQSEKFTVKSATLVDIISMSWSFNSKTANHDDKEVDNFRQMVAKASGSALLYGSLIDKEGKVEIGDFYPVGLTEVVRIGSATRYGGKADFSTGMAHFLFPGQDIPIPGVNGQVEIVNGSSVATAFAAGLAGIILYSIMAHKAMDDPLVREQVKEKRLKSIKTRPGMDKAFSTLAGSTAGDTPSDLYVGLVGKLFPDSVDDHQKVQEVRKFVESLSPTP